MILKLIAIAVGNTTAAYGAVCLWLYFNQTRLIFKPNQEVVAAQTADLSGYEDVWITPRSNSPGKIHGWWLPRQTAGELTLLYLHGNGENIGANLEHANRYRRMGFDVLLIDYRGYGRSPGPHPSEQRVYEDAIAAHRYLIQERQVSPQQLWLFGHSLGGAIAIDLATRQSVAGLIIQSSFSSMYQAVMATESYDWIPVRWLLHQHFDSLSKVPQLRVPTLYIHGLEDATTHPDMTVQLYQQTSADKALWLVPEADHNDVATVSGATYFTTIETFVEQTQTGNAIQPPRSPVE